MSTDPKKPVSRESDKFMLRFPDGMRDRITEAAKLSGRSMNTEIVQRLQTTFGGTSQGDMFDSDMARQTAMVELLTLVRRLDVVDLLELLQDIVPALPDEVVETQPELKANLKRLNRLMRRLRIDPDEAHRLSYAHQEKLKEVYGAEQDKMNKAFNIKPVPPPLTAPKKPSK